MPLDLLQARIRPGPSTAPLSATVMTHFPHTSRWTATGVALDTACRGVTRGRGGIKG